MDLLASFCFTEDLIILCYQPEITILYIVATGLQGGAEEAIHAMKEIFDDSRCDAVILVDANNAFNSLNRDAALHNIQYICPPFAPILINTYRIAARLIVNNGK